MQMLPNSDNYKFGILLFALITNFIWGPLLESSQYAWLSKLIMVLVLMTSLWVFSHKPHTLLIACLLSIPIIAASFVSLLTKNFFVDAIVQNTSGILFFTFVLSILLKKVLWARVIDAGIIMGAVCIYLLMGLAWAFLYAFIETLNPQSFSSVGMEGAKVGGFVYFSLITLTTVGYGDISPVTPIARSVAALQGVTGQMYLTILVARLVSIHSASKSVEQ